VELLVLVAVKDGSLKIMILTHRRHTVCPSRTSIVQVNFIARLTRNCSGEKRSGFMLNPTVHIITTVL